MKKTFIIFPALMLLIAGCVQNKQESNTTESATNTITEAREELPVYDIKQARAESSNLIGKMISVKDKVEADEFIGQGCNDAACVKRPDITPNGCFNCNINFSYELSLLTGRSSQLCFASSVGGGWWCSVGKGSDYLFIEVGDTIVVVGKWLNSDEFDVSEVYVE